LLEFNKFCIYFSQYAHKGLGDRRQTALRWLTANTMIYIMWYVSCEGGCMTHQAKKRGARSAAIAEAKVFMTGRSQAVRLPKEYRVSGDSVYVKRLGNGILLLPKTGDRWAGLFAALD